MADITDEDFQEELSTFGVNVDNNDAFEKSKKSTLFNFTTFSSHLCLRARTIIWQSFTKLVQLIWDEFIILIPEMIKCVIQFRWLWMLTRISST